MECKKCGAKECEPFEFICFDCLCELQTTNWIKENPEKTVEILMQNRDEE